MATQDLSFNIRMPAFVRCCARRLSRAAKDAGTYLDLTAGRTTKALVLMDNGKVYGCALTPRTIAQRIQMTANLEGETDDEAAEPEREDSEAD